MAQEVHNYTDASENTKEFSTIKIADDVVAMIAGYACKEVEGVAGMASGSSWLTKSVSGRTRGVRVEVVDGTVKTDLSVNMLYGYNIPATASKIQTRVQSAIESMTGLSVSDINIRIAGITMPAEEGAAPAQQ